jgi:protein deglycase
MLAIPGATHLRASKALTEILEKQVNAGKKYAAICAAPAVVLADQGMVGEGATCYPAPQFRSMLQNPTDEIVAVTGQLTTSKGPGTAIKFALELGEQLFGKEVRDKIEKEMLV